MKSSVELGVVQETLLLPLAARAYDAASKQPILNDQKALELFKQLTDNPKKYNKYLQRIGIIGLCERALIMDDIIANFIRQHPKGKILNIGVGLETSFYRLHQPEITWFDLDLPDSIALRKQLLPPPKQVSYIAKSMFDETWIQDIGSIKDGLLITVPGVFMYFDEATVRGFFNTFSSQLPNTEIVFDVISNMGRFFIGRQVKLAGMKHATMDWGIINPKDMLKWNKHLSLIDTHIFYKNLPNKSKYSPLLRFYMLQNQFYKIAQIFHLKFI